MGQVRYFCTTESVGYGSSLTLLYSTARIVHCFALKPQKWGFWVQFDIIKNMDNHVRVCTMEMQQNNSDTYKLNKTNARHGQT